MNLEPETCGYAASLPLLSPLSPSIFPTKNDTTMANERWREHDPYADQIILAKFDWRDEEVMRLIRNFTRFGKEDSRKNIMRLHALKTGQLVRSIGWKAWSDSGGDAEVFQETYLKYGQFVELAVGKGQPYNGPVPPIPGRAWKPITVPTRKRKAKPHSTAEMRKQARRFERLLVNHFSFIGLGFLTYAAGSNRENYDQINELLMRRRK